MNEKHSKILLSAEAAVFLAPVTALTVWICVFLVGQYHQGLGNESRGMHVAPVLTFIGLVCQAFGWWAIGVFLARGRDGLANLGGTCVLAIYGGALLAASGAVALVMVYIFGETRIFGYFVVNAVGLPALVPFAHVAIEHGRTAKRRANGLSATLLVRAIGLVAVGFCPLSMASDFPSPQEAWLPAPDGYAWPDAELTVDFKEYSTAELDSAVDGLLIPSLESADTPQRILAAWVDLGNDSRTLLYVDRALSGTGGKYIFVLARQNGQLKRLGQMLCEQVHLNEHARDGWKSITCIEQRGLQYQRMLVVMCRGEYRVSRHEVHDLEEGAVVLRPAACPE